jgi:hypothetical protein
MMEADQRSGADQPLYHLRAQDAGGGDFWLDLELNGSATLADVDDYLRAIWLECCGHLSQFSIGGWRGDEIPKTTRIGQIFKPEVQLTHIYDFGTSSETLIRFIGVRQGKPTTAHPIALMARNSPPDSQCMNCEQPATWLCTECIYEEDQSGMLCEEHVKGHPHDSYGEPVPVVNSPRLGLCGYEGPSDPPY